MSSKLATLLEQLNKQGVTTELYGDAQFPIMVYARDPQLTSDPEKAAQWVDQQKPLISDLLLEAGAVIFRGFAVPDSPDFERFLGAFKTVDFDYTGGGTDRGAPEGKVFQSTRARNDWRLVLHQEMAYMPRYPKRIAFYCRVAPDVGGETIISPMRGFTDKVRPGFMEKLRETGVLNIRNFRDEKRSAGHEKLDANHRTWQEAFLTQDPKEVEQKINDLGLEFEWQENGSVTMTYRGPAVINHPVTGEELWFNQINTQAPTDQSWGADRAALMRSELYNAKNPPPYDVRYGNGDPFEWEDVLTLNPIYDSACVGVPYEKGDVMLLDNFLVAHGRNPYEGQRDVKVMLFD